MYPPSAMAALLAQLETEAAVDSLAGIALRFWLPAAQQSVLHPEQVVTADVSDSPLDPSNIIASQQVWEEGLDQALVYGMQLIFAGEYLDAYVALGGEVADLYVSDNPARVAPPTTAGFTDAQSATLNAQARRAVSAALSRHLDEVLALDEQLATLPSLRELATDYADTVRNYVVNMPDEAYRALMVDLDAMTTEGADMDAMTAVVQKYLDWDTGDWPGRARTIARTESAGVQSAATIAAAMNRNAVLEEDLDQVWMATMDSRTRDTHFAADGQRTTLGGTFTVGGAALRYPGDPNAPASERINCRCRAAVLEASDPLPEEVDRHTERGEGDATVRNRTGSRQDEIDRRAEDGVTRARDDDAGVGQSSYDRGGIIPSGMNAERWYTAEQVRAMGESALAAFNEENPPMTDYRSFSSVLAVLGSTTDDGRRFAEDMALSFRPFPLPLMWQRQTSAMGHSESFTVGVLESASVDGNGQIVGEGYLLDTPEAIEAATQIEHGVTAPSVDLGDVDWIMTDEDGNELSDEAYMDWLWGDGDVKVIQTVTAGKLLGATLVATPAFSDTSVTLGELVSRGEDVNALVASMTASVIIEPRTYPAQWFQSPNFDAPAELRVTEDGRISGHLALWDTCHRGLADACTVAPHSLCDYAHFHTSPSLLSDEGTRIPVGRLTVDTGHAPDRMGRGPAVEHYDNTGACFAFVHVGEDAHGIWFSGIVNPDADERTIRRGMAAPLSGDWRRVGDNLELIAALAVNTPGFPIVASGATDEMDRPLALVAALGPCRAPADSALTASAIADEVVRRLKAQDAQAARSTEAQTLIAGQRRRDAAALIARVGGK